MYIHGVVAYKVDVLLIRKVINKQIKNLTHAYISLMGMIPPPQGGGSQGFNEFYDFGKS